MRSEDLYVGQRINWPASSEGIIYTVVEVCPDNRARLAWRDRNGEAVEPFDSFSILHASPVTTDIEEEEL